jgi:hypothetical protein
MIRDPFYNQIIHNLEKPLDPQAFEACACDVLRDIYPTLVPIPGGNDAGMDGAVADGEGRAYSLIATTEENVIDNLTKSLLSYKNKGGKRTKVIVATSQSLTQKRRANLEKKAEELGFALVQVHEREDIANRLYRNSRWCQELLGLSGKPLALSVLPLTRRPIIELPLIGREEDLTWVRNTDGDIIITGQPGCGKTFLLWNLAKEGEAYFIASEDFGEICAAIREISPERIIVDDAHLPKRLSLIGELKHFRKETEAKFRIIADCWPGERDAVISALNIGEKSVRELLLLDRGEIVQVINNLGIRGPTQLIRELVNQSCGRPGLVVTLCQLCLKNNIEEVVLGNAIARDIRGYFEQVIGRRAVAIIAAFAVGGDSGMSLGIVASALDIPLVDVQNATVQLAAGGVLREIERGRLSVHPDVLRFALVRDVFYAGGASFPMEKIIEASERTDNVTLTLIGASSRGAKIPDMEIRPMVEGATRDEVWKAYAWLGHEECKWVLEKHPEETMVITHAALHWCPEKIIPELLRRAIGDERAQHSHPEHPLRLISDWVAAAYPGTPEVVRRRKRVMEGAVRWIRNGENITVGLNACAAALSPDFGLIESDPGLGRMMSLLQGHITEDDMRKVQQLWPEVIKIIEETKIEDWEPIRKAVNEWAYPRIGSGQKIPDETQRFMRSFVRKMLVDILHFAGEQQGILRWIKQVAKNKRFRLNVKLDPEFEVLYPLKDRNWQRRQRNIEKAVGKIAEKWKREVPEVIVNKLVNFGKQAKQSGDSWSSGPRILCNKLAEIVEKRGRWVRDMIGKECDCYLPTPFLCKMVENEEEGWEELLEKCLDMHELRIPCVEIVLRKENVPESLLNKIFTKLEGLGEVIRITVAFGISEKNVESLLKYPDKNIAANAAIGEWETKPKGSVREGIRNSWREAILKCNWDEYVLGDIFAANSNLAYDWLLERIAEDSDVLWGTENVSSEAVKHLSEEQKQCLLREMKLTFGCEHLARRVVGQSTNLYQELLRHNKNKHLHLAVLKDKFEERFIRAALDAGYSMEEVSGALHGYSYSWEGKESDMWGELVASYEILCLAKDNDVREVGKIGKEYALACQKDSKERERKRDVYGEY